MKNIWRLRPWVILAIVVVLAFVLAWVFYMMLQLQKNWGPL